MASDSQLGSWSTAPAAPLNRLVGTPLHLAHAYHTGAFAIAAPAPFWRVSVPTVPEPSSATASPSSSSAEVDQLAGVGNEARALDRVDLHFIAAERTAATVDLRPTVLPPVPLSQSPIAIAIPSCLRNAV